LAELADITTLEKDHPFVECATFADEIKRKGFDTQAHWHFVDNPFMDQGYDKNITANEYNVTWAIVSIYLILKLILGGNDFSS
jgi:hypothetical protein